MSLPQEPQNLSNNYPSEIDDEIAALLKESNVPSSKRPAAEEEDPEAPKFVPFTLGQLISMPPKPWLVENMIGEGDTAMIYGASGSGKTHVVIDFCFAACLGQDFAERFTTTRPLKIAYACGEGWRGLGSRFAAVAQHYGVADLPNLYIFPIAPQLYTRDTAATIDRFALDWQRQGDHQLDVLVIDTLHTAIEGADENSSKDMGLVLGAVRRVKEDLGCAVILVHHTNKAGNGERGSSALRGAMDAMIEVSADSGKHSMNCAKLKDGEGWKPQTFDLVTMGESVRVWWDEPTKDETGDKRKSETAREILGLLDSVNGKSLTAKQISDASEHKPQQVNKVCARLEKQKFIMRSQNERATWCFTITPEGKAALTRNEVI